MACNFVVISGTCGYSTSDGVTSATGSIQDFHGYLSAVSDQCPGYVESFRRMGLRARFCQAIVHCSGNLQSSHYQAGRPGPHFGAS
jgi:hypothetical protein